MGKNRQGAAGRAYWTNVNAIARRLLALEQRAKMQSEGFAEMMSGGDFVMADVMTPEAWKKAVTEYMAKLTGQAADMKTVKAQVSTDRRRRGIAHRSPKISVADTVC
jgi:hypothetical protein